MATSNKTIPAFVLGAVFGGAIAYFGLTNPPGDALTGAVAPAERYRAEQPSSDGIQLGDQGIQQLMQTDAFDRLISDESFRALAASAEFAELAGNCLVSRNWRATPQPCPNLAATLTLPRWRAMLSFAELAANASFAELMANAGFAQLAGQCQLCPAGWPMPTLPSWRPTLKALPR